MKFNGSLSRLILGGFVAAGVLVGCGGSGDINISPVTTDSSTDNSVNNSNNVAAPVANPCASNGQIQVISTLRTACTQRHSQIPETTSTLI